MLSADAAGAPLAEATDLCLQAFSQPCRDALITGQNDASTPLLRATQGLCWLARGLAMRKQRHSALEVLLDLLQAWQPTPSPASVDTAPDPTGSGSSIKSAALHQPLMASPAEIVSTAVRADTQSMTSEAASPDATATLAVKAGAGQGLSEEAVLAAAQAFAGSASTDCPSTSAATLSRAYHAQVWSLSLWCSAPVITRADACLCAPGSQECQCNMT